MPPKKHAFTAKAVWADFWQMVICSGSPERENNLVRRDNMSNVFLFSVSSLCHSHGQLTVSFWFRNWRKTACKSTCAGRSHTIGICVILRHLSNRLGQYFAFQPHPELPTTNHTSSTWRKFHNRKPIGESGCCESRMTERIH